jgi:UDP-N-acetylmuramate--alanine ligase
VCLNLGANLNLVKKSLKNFSGVQRRMTKIFSKNNNDFYDDYAHHPTEIASILEGVHNVNSKRKIISIFEPHRYSRVMSLKNEFSKCFSKSNLVIICPLYAAGEKKNYKFDLTKLAGLIIKNSKTQVIIVKNEIDLSKYLKKNLTSDEIIIGMGAGAISKWMAGLKYSL